ncbi:sugar phosphate isomerase/epimerase family protein [Neolewinella antarctica]|uniref:Sugar phosphate isomerase/epimerase n=1 Tax=Neolewinella antarctica TaxID=442734 RepID=A0ABX0XD58_9BACT|nr:sugar phosphate isomerase/epimerase family protein [Neolewinella antarctica]NJC27233.1 sugar phosphate isomerase/epimerase [Neolewinella antarctica]
MQRRNFLQTTSRAGAGLSLLGLGYACTSGSTKPAVADATADVPTVRDWFPTDTWFDISLAQWSLNEALFAKQLDNLDFARTARETYGLGGVEYVSQFFKDRAKDTAYLAQMKQRARDQEVKSLLIMIDGEGNLGDKDKTARNIAVENHHKWVDAAAFLGCHSIRVNAAGEGSRAEVAKGASESLRKLSEYAAKASVNVLVENHGGYSSDGSWLAGVLKNADASNCGSLPDFGNFCITRDVSGEGCREEYDRYLGVRELMPYARAVSAKSYDFDDTGNETTTDYAKMMTIVKEAGYKGWVGIEYEGKQLSADAGIRRTIDILRRNGGRVG